MSDGPRDCFMAPLTASDHMKEAACAAWYGCADWRERFYPTSAWSKAQEALDAMGRAYQAMLKAAEAEPK